MTVDLLKVVPGRSARAFNRFRTTRAVALDISKAFKRVWYVGLVPKLKSNGISGQYLALFHRFSFFSVIEGFKWF